MLGHTSFTVLTASVSVSVLYSNSVLQKYAAQVKIENGELNNICNEICTRCFGYNT